MRKKKIVGSSIKIYRDIMDFSLKCTKKKKMALGGGNRQLFLTLFTGSSSIFSELFQRERVRERECVYLWVWTVQNQGFRGLKIKDIMCQSYPKRRNE